MELTSGSQRDQPVLSDPPGPAQAQSHREDRAEDRLELAPARDRPAARKETAISPSGARPSGEKRGSYGCSACGDLRTSCRSRAPLRRFSTQSVAKPTADMGRASAPPAIWRGVPFRPERASVPRLPSGRGIHGTGNTGAISCGSAGRSLSDLDLYAARSRELLRIRARAGPPRSSLRIRLPGPSNP